jgi:hypothetical protein
METEQILNLPYSLYQSRRLTAVHLVMIILLKQSLTTCIGIFYIKKIWILSVACIDTLRNIHRTKTTMKSGPTPWQIYDDDDDNNNNNNFLGIRLSICKDDKCKLLVWNYVLSLKITWDNDLLLWYTEKCTAKCLLISKKTI